MYLLQAVITCLYSFSKFIIGERYLRSPINLSIDEVKRLAEKNKNKSFYFSAVGDEVLIRKRTLISSGSHYIELSASGEETSCSVRMNKAERFFLIFFINTIILFSMAGLLLSIFGAFVLKDPDYNLTVGLLMPVVAAILLIFLKGICLYLRLLSGVSRPEKVMELLGLS